MSLFIGLYLAGKGIDPSVWAEFQSSYFLDYKTSECHAKWGFVGMVGSLPRGSKGFQRAVGNMGCTRYTVFLYSKIDMYITPIAPSNPDAPKLTVPLFATSVAAGFPSPADDYIEQPLDLNQHVIEHPSATYFARADGDSLMELGIQHGDLLVVSRALTPQDGQVVVVALDGELCCKVLDRKAGLLRPANPQYAPIPITPAASLEVEGVVTHAIHYLPGSR